MAVELEPAAGAPDRLRAAQAQGGRALHPRQGQLPRRHPPARDAARRDPAQPVRARADQLDRHLGGARAPERRGGDHGQGPRDARPGVDADDLLRHAGRARGRQGPLPGPGGRVRDRDRRVLGARRAAADRRRLRAAAGGRQRAQGARRRRAADPRRQGRASATTSPARPGRRATRRRPTARSPRPTRSSTRDIIYPRCHPAPLETCGIIADFNPETGQLDIYNGNQAPHAHRTVYAHVAGLAEHMIRIMLQRHRRRLRQQGARSIRATCARSPARSSPACR